MSETAELEAAWLRYAVGVVRSAQRPDPRVAQPGGKGDPDGGNALSFPGHLGAGYEPERGVLVVGAVHNVPKAGAPHLKDNVRWVQAHRRFMELGEPGGEAFLRENRRYYQGPAGLRAWSTGVLLLPVVDRLGIGLDGVAYTNLCKRRERSGGGNSAKLAMDAQRDFPVAELVELLRPCAVLCCVADAEPSRGNVNWFPASGWQPEVYVCEGRNGLLVDRRLRPDDPQRRPASWHARAAERIQARRQQAA